MATSVGDNKREMMSAQGQRARQDGTRASHAVLPYRVVTEARIDYKYSRIVENLPVDYVCRSFWGAIRDFLGGPDVVRPRAFHIRYLKWRGFVGTILRYAVLLGLCKLRGIRVVWSCHNIRSYNIPSRSFNRFLRSGIGACADAIVVFDPAMTRYVRTRASKVHVASFGEFRSLYEKSGSDRGSQAPFLHQCRDWLKSRGDGGDTLLFMGTYAPSKRVETLLRIAQLNAQLSVVLLAPGMQVSGALPENVFLHTEWVDSGVREILATPGLVGFIGHGNISVPTALYVFASFKIPILALDSPPINRIVSENDLGRVIGSPQEAGKVVHQIRARYTFHARALERFLHLRSWDASSEAHRAAFGLG